MRKRIRSDAKISITQECACCEGTGIGALGVISRCRNCGHHYTQAEMEQESRTWTHESERQGCGCEWRYRVEVDDTCAECEGTGTQHLSVTLTELAQAIGDVLAQVQRMTPRSSR